MRSKQVALPSANFCRTRHPKAHGRPPGVNTYLSARGRRVYPLRQQWIEDFALCCRLVPTNSKPNSVSIRHPVHLRYPASAGRPPSEMPSPTPPCTTATSFASIRLDLGLAIYRNYDICSPLRHVPCPAHNKAAQADSLPFRCAPGQAAA